MIAKTGLIRYLNKGLKQEFLKSNKLVNETLWLICNIFSLEDVELLNIAEINETIPILLDFIDLKDLELFEQV